MRSGARKALQLLLNFGSSPSSRLVQTDLRLFELSFSTTIVIPETHSTANKWGTASQ